MATRLLTIRRTKSGRHDSPEARLQSAVVRYLIWCLPPEIDWWPSFAGKKRTQREQAAAKAQGMRRGEPDLKFVLPDDTCVWIELKSPTGTLTSEQRDFFRRHQRVTALCRSVDDVERSLRDWGVAMRNRPFDPTAHGAP